MLLLIRLTFRPIKLKVHRLDGLNAPCLGSLTHFMAGLIIAIAPLVNKQVSAIAQSPTSPKTTIARSHHQPYVVAPLTQTHDREIFAKQNRL